MALDFSGGLRRMMRDRGFVLFCLINFIWTLGIQSSAPFFTVHMVQDLNFQVGTISLLATTTTIASVVAVRLAGNLIDRYGPARITALGMLLVPLMPLAWTLANTPLSVGIVRAYGVIAWAGVQVGGHALDATHHTAGIPRPVHRHFQHHQRPGGHHRPPSPAAISMPTMASTWCSTSRRRGAAWAPCSI